MALTFQATSLRNDGYIALSRLLQIILAIVVVALVGSGFPSWNSSDGCSVPQSMNYMVASGLVTSFYIVYLTISTWSSCTTFLWNPYVQLGLDGLFMILWIAFCVVAKPTCGQFADACANWISTSTGSLAVPRTWNNLELSCGRHGCSCAPYTTGSGIGIDKRASTSSAVKSGISFTSWLEEQQGLGVALVILFAFSLGLGLYRFVQDKRTVKASPNKSKDGPFTIDNKSTESQETVSEVSA